MRRNFGWLRKLPSGNYQASYFHGEKRHFAPNTFGTKIAAEAWLGAEKKLIDFDQWTPVTSRVARRKLESVTLDEYGKRWISERQLKPRTRLEYESMFTRLVAPGLGAVQLRELDAGAVRAWFHGLGHKYVRRNSHAYGLLHAILATAVDDELIAVNPARMRKVMNPPTTHQPVILTIDEIRLVNESLPENYRAMFLIMVFLGTRWGETIELRRGDVSAGCDYLSVSRAATHRGVCRVSTTKSGHARVVAIPNAIQETIKHHLNSFVGEAQDSLLFAAPKAACNHKNETSFKRGVFRPALETIGRTDFRIHDCRHTAGTLAALAGATLRELQDRLGHQTPKAAMTYQQIAQGRDAVLADRLSAMIDSAN
jgi:integrase